ncbi:MAG TPA: pyridoxamine 5'-phosphate oxidase family protein [Solirubrobacteraceae bacterium]|nr:pyridoxamine 5'-phosphate oxidase family protein [Solirubrobacteraceae bacterium]
MSALTPALCEFLDGQIVGVLATERSGAHALQSVVYYARDGERLLVSSVAGRRKVTDVELTGWASICVMGFERPYPSATFSGSAQILTDGIGPATAAVAQRVTGSDEPPEPQTDEALAAAGRVIVAITIERVSAVTHMER